MNAIPGDLETDRQPPMTIPLRHFLVGLGLLCLGLVVGIGGRLQFVPGDTALAQLHLLLAGWVSVTIMGAMTQFVPVWSATDLHSRRLAAGQLWLVVFGILGFAFSLLLGRYRLLAVSGLVMALGFWVFVYNLARTLLTLESYDVTETHFAFALACFLAVTLLGVLLAIDFTEPLFRNVGISRPRVRQAHATLAVFGAVTTTVVGALYQLATMFTQTDLDNLDRWIQRIETVGLPAGILLLAAGRLLEFVTLIRIGGVLVAASLLGVSLVLARRLRETRVDWTPMLSRYTVVALALALWSLLALPAWLTRPLAYDGALGAPGTRYLFVVGVVGFVVLGTLYHIVPFIIWVHRYSDLLGYEAVPMIDDLYSDRLAATDFTLFVAGTATLVVADWFDLTETVIAAGGLLLLAGAVCFLTNMLLVVRKHSPEPLLAILFGIDQSTEQAPVDQPDSADRS